MRVDNPGAELYILLVQHFAAPLGLQAQACILRCTRAVPLCCVSSACGVESSESRMLMPFECTGPHVAGGSAVASDTIHREMCNLRAAGKPLVVSMGNYAASGGCDLLIEFY